MRKFREKNRNLKKATFLRKFIIKDKKASTSMVFTKSLRNTKKKFPIFPHFFAANPNRNAGFRSYEKTTSNIRF